MQCIIIFSGKDYPLPTAQQLRQAGFHVSKAVLTPEPLHSEAEGKRPRNVVRPDSGEALAAEEPAPYPQYNR